MFNFKALIQPNTIAMNRKLTLLLFLLYTCAAQAQVRTGITAGPAFNLKGKNNDSAFFGRNYFNLQLRAGIHKGRLGLVFSGGIINQNPGSVPVNERLNIDAQGAIGSVQFSGGEVRNTFFAAGPELCFPFGPVRLTAFFAGGIGWLNATTVSIARNTTPDPLYRSELEQNTTGITKAGIGFHYYFNKRIALTVNSERLGYRLKYTNLDRRRQAQPTITITERKSLAAVSGGITFKF